MKKLIIILLSFQCIQASVQTKVKSTLQERVAQFKQENPHTMNIIMGYLKHGFNYGFTTAFPNMEISHHLQPESAYYRFDTKLTINDSLLLEPEKESTTPTRLYNLCKEKNVVSTEFKELDKHSKCSISSACSPITTYWCITYIPKEIFQAIKDEVDGSLLNSFFSLFSK